MRTSVQRRPLKFDCLRDSVAEVHRLNESGYVKAGNWDLAQMCQHLSKSARIAIEGAPFSLPSFLKPVARWLLFDTIMKGQRTRLPLITAPQFRPEASPDADQEIAEYESLVNQVMADDADLLPDHPLFGIVTPDYWHQFFTWHAAHHLSYLIPNETNAADATARSTTDH